MSSLITNENCFQQLVGFRWKRWRWYAIYRTLETSSHQAIDFFIQREKLKVDHRRFQISCALQINTKSVNRWRTIHRAIHLRTSPWRWLSGSVIRRMAFSINSKFVSDSPAVSEINRDVISIVSSWDGVLCKWYYNRLFLII